jgi:Yeast mitochondrial distribution and morphology (MDM) proteins
MSLTLALLPIRHPVRYRPVIIFINSRSVGDTTTLGLGSRWASLRTNSSPSRVCFSLARARFHSCARSGSSRTDGHTTSTSPPSHYENYPPFLKQLALSLPKNPNPNPHPSHPTLDDFLKTTSSFWQRARLRFKWFTIKSFRKFNADDISAFVTWFLGAQVLWFWLGREWSFSLLLLVFGVELTYLYFVAILSFLSCSLPRTAYDSKDRPRPIPYPNPN